MLDDLPTRHAEPVGVPPGHLLAVGLYSHDHSMCTAFDHKHRGNKFRIRDDAFHAPDCGWKASQHNPQRGGQTSPPWWTTRLHPMIDQIRGECSQGTFEIPVFQRPKVVEDHQLVGIREIALGFSEYAGRSMIV